MARDTIDLTPIETRHELIEWFEKGIKPENQFRIGTEHEKFPFYATTHRPVGYEGPRGIRALLDGMQALLGWSPFWRMACPSAFSMSPGVARSASSPAVSSNCLVPRSKPSTRPAWNSARISHN